MPVFISVKLAVDNKTDFFCVFGKNDDGNIILCDCNSIFLKLAGAKKSDIKKEVKKIMSAGCYESLSVYFEKNLSCKFIRETSGGKVWLVEMISLNGQIVFKGEPISDFSAFFWKNREFFSSREKLAYIGTAVIDCEIGKYIFCSDKISKMSCCSEGIGFLNDKIFGIFRESVKENIPLSFYELIGEDVVKLDVFPAASEGKNAVAVSLYKKFPNHESVSDSAYCEICLYDDCPYVVGMNDTMSEMLENGIISLSDIISGAPDDFRVKTAESSYSVRYIQKDKKGYFAVINFVPAPSEPLKKLSIRENHALYLAAKGNPNKYIAHVMGISEGTVKKMLHNGYMKLGISSRVELVRLYESHNNGGKN